MKHANIGNYAVAPDQKKKCFGGKYFFAFNDENGKYLFKKAHTTKGLLSELFHSAVGNRLGLPCAENSPAILVNGTEEFGIISKNFLSDNETYTDASKIIDRAKIDYLVPHKTDMRLLQTLDLSSLPKMKCKPGIVRAFLMSHISDNMDMNDFHNVGIIMPDGTAAPSFDFEFSKNFRTDFNFTEEDTKLLAKQCSIHPKNIRHLKRSFPQITEEFLDNICTLRDDPNFRDMCDFVPLAATAAYHIENNKSADDAEGCLFEFSEQTFKTYTAKFAGIADAFAK